MKINNSIKRPLSFIMALVLVLSLITSSGFTQNAQAAADTSREIVVSVLEGALDYMHYNMGQDGPVVDSIGGEWLVLGLARSGHASRYLESLKSQYSYNLNKYIEDHRYLDSSSNPEAVYVGEPGTDGTRTVRLHRNKYTENERVVIALTALGYNAANWNGYNFVNSLSNSGVVTQGTNAVIYAVIALDTNNYCPVSENPRGRYLTHIIEKQKSGGGWDLDGISPSAPADPDMTGMALQALAPYYKLGEGGYNALNLTDAPAYSQIKAAVDKALNALKTMQNTGGGFTGAYGASSESASQVLAALAALGTQDSSFIQSVLANLLTYYKADKYAFEHIKGSGANDMATEQAAYALIAYLRYLDGANTLYNMNPVSDWSLYGGIVQPPQKYSVTVTNGTCGGEYEPGAAVTITANAAASGKQFKQWSFSPSVSLTGGTSVTDKTVKFVMPAQNVTALAAYEDAPVTPTQKYAVTVTNGTGSGNYEQGAAVTLTASAAPSGKKFAHWDFSPSVSVTGGTSVTDKTVKFVMPAQPVTAAAVYEDIPAAPADKYTVTVTNGTGGGEYEPGETVTVTANAAVPGKKFKQWSFSPSVSLTGGTKLSDETAKFTMPAQNVTALAMYEDETETPAEKHTVTVTNGTGGGEYEPGAAVTVTANAAAPGKQFKQWSFSPSVSLADGTSVTDETAKFTMPAQNVTALATYEDAPETPADKFIVTVKNGTGGGEYMPGYTVTIIADEAPEDKLFDYWSFVPDVSVTGGTSITDWAMKFVMPEQAVTATAVYKDETETPVEKHTVTVTNGTGSGEYEQGAAVTVTANAAAPGKQFKQWSFSPSVSLTDGTSVTDETAKFTMPAQNVTALATYEDAPETPADKFTVTVKNGTGGGEYEPGDTVTIIADDAPAGKLFDYWSFVPDVSVTGGTSITDWAMKFVMPSQAVTVTAVYKDEAGTPPAKLLNFDRLDALKKAANALDGADYTNWQMVAGFLATDNDWYTTQEAVDSAASLLEAAIKNLVFKPDAGSADEAALAAALDTAITKAVENIGGAEQSDSNDTYTPDSWNTYAEALAEAKRVLALVKAKAQPLSLLSTVTAFSAADDELAAQLKAAKRNLAAAIQGLTPYVKSNDASLKALSITSASLNPNFTPEITSYTASVENSVTSVTVYVTPNSSKAVVSGTGIKNLNVGTNTVIVTVTAEDSSTRLYTITITRSSSVDKSSLISKINYAESLSESNYTSASWQNLKTALSNAKYVRDNQNAAQSQVNIAVNAVTDAIAALVQKDGDTISVSFRLIGCTKSSGDVNFGNGIDWKGAEYQNWVKTIVYTIPKDSKVYDLYVKALGDAGLTSIGHDKNYVETIYAPSVLGGYALSEFTNGAYSGWMYTVNGSHPDVGLKDKVLQNGDVVIWHYVNDYRYEESDGGGTGSGTIGNSSTWNQWLKASDIQPWEVASSAAELSTLTVSGVTLQPSFSPSVTSYTASVPYNTSSITISATADSSKLTVTGTGSKTLNVGTNTFTVTVKSDSGSVRNYIIKITRESQDSEDSDAALKSLTVSGVTLQPSFDKDVTYYTATVENSVESVTVSAASSSDSAEVSGTGKRALTSGQNTITIKVSTKDGTAKNYTVVITRKSADVQESSAGKGMYTDVQSNAWYNESVEYVTSKGLMTGTGDNKFSPDMNLTRAMIITIIARMAGVDTTKGHTWYSAASDWGVAQGITDGKNLEHDVTREQLITMLWRYSREPAVNGTIASYSDADIVSDWAAAAMCWAVDIGLIVGRANNDLAPVSTATRAETATLLMRYFKVFME